MENGVYFLAIVCRIFVRANDCQVNMEKVQEGHTERHVEFKMSSLMKVLAFSQNRLAELHKHIVDLKTLNGSGQHILQLEIDWNHPGVLKDSGHHFTITTIDKMYNRFEET
ncbi:hypothetical protein TNCV_1733131 [Trichonephila clavipes]|nr:hypothetical protein TNCV_1733131 [Trichonephila clavipes]